MRAIILAAGRGTRLGKYGADLPKCMLRFRNTPLIEWQTAALQHGGISEIAVVLGFSADKVTVRGVTKRYNERFATTNMLETFMCARDWFEGEGEDVLICYGDILYEPRLVSSMVQSDAEVGVLVDVEWRDYWVARHGALSEDLETLKIDDGRITQLGGVTREPNEMMARYVGMIRISADAIPAVLSIYDRARANFAKSPLPWRESKSFQQAYMTCFLQELIDNGITVRAVACAHGWLEFDTERDYELGSVWTSDGTLQRFINLSECHLAGRNS